MEIQPRTGLFPRYGYLASNFKGKGGDRMIVPGTACGAIFVFVVAGTSACARARRADSQDSSVAKPCLRLQTDFGSIVGQAIEAAMEANRLWCKGKNRPK